jgi:hypothetical protein
MKTSRMLLALSLALFARGAVAQEQASPLMTPTKAHEEMARDVGVWDAESTTWMTPDAEPMTSKGVETNKLLGKMWLISEFQGEFGGEEFHGHAQVGYDPLKKKYIGTWADTISPFLYTLEGEYDVATHTLTMMMNGTSAMTGKPETAKNVTRYTDEDHKVFEMYMPVEGQDGKWWKMMEIKYTRRK